MRECEGENWGIRSEPASTPASSARAVAEAGRHYLSQRPCTSMEVVLSGTPFSTFTTDTATSEMTVTIRM